MTTATNSRVIVGVDDSLSGLRALRFAVAEARRRDAVLHAIRVAPSGTPTGGAYLQRQLRRDAAEKLADSFAAAFGGFPRDLEIQALTIDGDAGQVLVEYADRDGDLLVVGSGQRPWWRRLSGRSTSRYCFTHASCPLLVVPTDAFAREAGRGRMTRALMRDLASFSTR